MGNINAARLKPILLYWGAMTTEQAAHFLERFYKVENPSSIVDYLVQCRYLSHLQGRENLVSLSDFPKIVFNEGKERCIWVYFEYVRTILATIGKWPQIVTHNDFYGVNFKLPRRDESKGETYNDKEYYCMVYVDPQDYTYRNIIKTLYDEQTTFIFVTDDKATAEKIEKINTKDKIWYVQKVNGKWDVVQYMGKA